MTTIKGLLQWSEVEQPVEFLDGDELDKYLDKLTNICESKSPLIVTLHVHDQEVSFGLGSEWSFVQVEHASGNPPYQITQGHLPRDGMIDFFLHGNHHTAIPRQYLIPAKQARLVVREFFDTGRRSENVEWEEI